MAADYPEPVTLALTVTGWPEQVGRFAQLCKTLGALGAVGASRTVRVEFDGDGAARLDFDFGATDVSAVEVPDFDDDDEIPIWFD